MMLPRRRFLQLAAGVAAFPAAPRIAQAQTFPSRPVRIIVPTAAGGPNDILTRLIGQWLSEHLGQPVIIENRPGAGTNLATEVVVRAPPDGYTLFSAGPASAINATLYDKLSFNFLRDTAPVAGIMRVSNILVVHPSFPAKTVPEFIAYAKANPGKLSMASGGIGSGSHMAGELFKQMAGVDMVHVPYRGAGPALGDVLGGQVQVMLDLMPNSIEHIRAGKLRGLAVTTAMRSQELPDIPNVGDFVPGYEASAVFGICRPREHAGRRRRQAQQGNQCGPRRSRHQSQACSAQRRSAGRLGRRLGQALRRRNGEVGQGDPRGPHQGGISGRFRPLGRSDRLLQPRPFPEPPKRLPMNAPAKVSSTIPFDAARLDKLMDEAGMDVLIATSKHNVQYLLGGHRAFFFDYMDAMGLSRYLPVLVYAKGAPDKAAYFGHRLESFQRENNPFWTPVQTDKLVGLGRHHAEGDRAHPQGRHQDARHRRRAVVSAGRCRQGAAKRVPRQQDDRRAVRAGADALDQDAGGIEEAQDRLGGGDRVRCRR